MLQWITTTIKDLKRTAKAGRLILLVVLFYFILSIPAALPTQAQTLSQADPSSELMEGVTMIEEPLGLPSTDIRLVIARIIRIALSLVGIVMLVLIIYAGYLWMTAGGNSDQITSAKNILKNAVIGLAIILSAYAIVFFVMRMLGVNLDGTYIYSPKTPAGINNLIGSGALGRSIKDHYPQRDQIDVPRNTKIIITFFNPISLDGFVEDVNSDGVLGTCDDSVANWKTDCDQLRLNDDYINIYKIIKDEDGGVSYDPIESASILASVTPSSTGRAEGIYTIVIRPNEYLGSEFEDVSYKVRLGKEIKRGEPELSQQSIFGNLSSLKFYEWIFTCGTELDLTPPYVTSVYPADGETEYKNTVIQISFNEPINPIGVQGKFADKISSGNDYFFLENGFIYLKNEKINQPVGIMDLVNNYQTLEFTPTTPCGKNACGGTVYCLPVCDKVGENCSSSEYEILLQAAKTINVDTFEAQPFTGIEDVSGNALDGNNDGKVDTAPTITDELDKGKKPDNYFWSFTIKDEMDLTPPVIYKITPRAETTYVESRQDWIMWFNKRMRIDPMYSIYIEESPTPEERCKCYGYDDNGKCLVIPKENCVLDELWHVPFVTFNTTTPMTMVRKNHGPFLDGLAQGYIPIISSAVEDVHFNCLFPGQGPEQGLPDKILDENKESLICNSEECCIKKDSTEVLCCNGESHANDLEECISKLLIKTSN